MWTLLVWHGKFHSIWDGEVNTSKENMDWKIPANPTQCIKVYIINTDKKKVLSKYTNIHKYKYIKYINLLYIKINYMQESCYIKIF
jgi:hypothetical protein